MSGRDPLLEAARALRETPEPGWAQVRAAGVLRAVRSVRPSAPVRVETPPAVAALTVSSDVLQRLLRSAVERELPSVTVESLRCKLSGAGELDRAQAGIAVPWDADLTAVGEEVRALLDRRVREILGTAAAAAAVDVTVVDVLVAEDLVAEDLADEQVGPGPGRG